MGSADPGSARSTFWWRLLVVLLALPVHVVSLALLAGGFVLLIYGQHWVVVGSAWVIRALGILLILMAYGTHPHFPRRPAYLMRLTPANAPALFELVDRVAAANDAPAPAEILVVPDFNAFATRVGWRRTPVLGIGAPLWVAASPQARVALLAHELGHFAHRDLRYGLWVDSAVQTLLYWHDMMLGMRRVTYSNHAAHTHFIQEYLFAPVRWMIVGYVLLIVRLTGPSNQRGEYRADLDAIRAAGSEGAVAMLDALLNAATVETAITRAAVHPRRPDMWETVTAALAEQPAHFAEGRRRHAALVTNRIDDSHPATHLRIKLVQGRSSETARVVLDSGLSHAIGRELEPAMALAAKRIGEMVRYQA